MADRFKKERLFILHPLYPQKRTFTGVNGMSALCHKQTFPKLRNIFDAPIFAVS
jgi:hypothetical protein